MEPTGRRRATWAGLGLAAVALIFVVGLLAHPRNHSGRESIARRSGEALDGGHVAQNFYERGHVVGKLVYGMTKQQVLARVGRPVKVIRWQGLPCWQYAINEHYPADDAGPAYTLNAVAACFLAGRYAAPRYEIDGKWGYDLRTKTVTD